eukprot:4532451-Amphidinium_carterae.1
MPSSPEEELVLRDLATRLDARPVFHECSISWHPLAGAVPQVQVLPSSARPSLSRHSWRTCLTLQWPFAATIVLRPDSM